MIYLKNFMSDVKAYFFTLTQSTVCFLRQTEAFLLAEEGGGVAKGFLKDEMGGNRKIEREEG